MMMRNSLRYVEQDWRIISEADGEQMKFVHLIRELRCLMISRVCILYTGFIMLILFIFRKI